MSSRFVFQFQDRAGNRLVGFNDFMFNALWLLLWNRGIGVATSNFTRLGEGLAVAAVAGRE